MENRNLQWNKRVKVPLILIFSVNTNHESVAYRSFSPSKFEARGARKVTTGMAVVPRRAGLPGSNSRLRAALHLVLEMSGSTIQGCPRQLGA